MKMSVKADVNLKGLKQLEKALGKKLPSIKVGILGSKASRSGDGVNNATIGVYHEFGSGSNPVRSFLRMPLSTKLYQKLAKQGTLDQSTIDDMVERGKADQLLKEIAATGEAVVLEAFDTGGYGQWDASNMDRKKVHQTLVETQQLRDSITSEIE